MPRNTKQVGEHRFRESFGRYYEDFEIGHVYGHRPARTITETDNTWFTLPGKPVTLTASAPVRVTGRPPAGRASLCRSMVAPGRRQIRRLDWRRLAPGHRAFHARAGAERLRHGWGAGSHPYNSNASSQATGTVSANRVA